MNSLNQGGRPTRLVVVDQCRLLGEGLAERVERTLGWHCVAIVGGPEQFETYSGGEADLVLLDPTQAEAEPDALRDLCRNRFGPVEVVAFLPPDADALAMSCLQTGFSGVLSRAEELDSVTLALQTIHAGGIFVDGCFGCIAEVTAPVSLSGAEGLSEREMQVLISMARGESAKETGRSLSISPKTVDTHRQRGMQKIGLSGRASVVRHALENDWLD